MGWPLTWHLGPLHRTPQSHPHRRWCRLWRSGQPGRCEARVTGHCQEWSLAGPHSACKAALGRGGVFTVSLRGQAHALLLLPRGPELENFSTGRNFEISKIDQTPLSGPQSPQEENGLSGLQGSHEEGRSPGKAGRGWRHWPRSISWLCPLLPQFSGC